MASSPVLDSFATETPSEALTSMQKESALLAASAAALADDLRAAILDIVASDDEANVLRAQATRAFDSFPDSSLDDLRTALQPTVERVQSELAADPGLVYPAGERVFYQAIGQTLRNLTAIQYHLGFEPKNWEVRWGQKAGFYAGLHLENTLNA